MNALRGIRGAVQVSDDTLAAIDAATRELLRSMVERNAIDPTTVAAVWFTQTPDLTAAHAATAARELGWHDVPLLGAQEAPVAGQMARVVRVLMLVPMPDGRAVKHAYLGGARALREDRC